MKKFLSIILAIIIFLSFMSSSFAVSTSNENTSNTDLRMSRIRKQYDKMTNSQIQKQIDKYDDIQGHFGEKYIARLAVLEIIVGDGVSKFNPNDTLLACQYIKMLVMAIGYTPEIVPGTVWWEPFINLALKESLIFEGEITDYTKPITRELAGVIGFRTLMKYRERPEGENKWFDYNKSKVLDYAHISDQYKEEVIMAYRMGIIQGYDGIYEPKGTLTRAQAAIIVNKLIDDNIRIESVPQEDEILVFKLREDMNPALFDWGLEPGKVSKIYPGDFPINEVYDVAKVMFENINVGGGFKELSYTSPKHNLIMDQFNLKSDADYFWNSENRLPKNYGSAVIYASKIYEKDKLKNNSTGFLYKVRSSNVKLYDKQMKDYVYKILEVLFEEDFNKAVELHDFYLNSALGQNPNIYDIYYLNNRQVYFNALPGVFEIQIWGKNMIKEENIFKF